MSIKRLSGAGLTTPKSNKLWDQVTFQSGMFAIATVSLTSTASSITFTDIPANYTHLQLRCFAKNATTGNADYDSLRMRVNGDTGSNYSTHYIQSQAGASVGATYASSTVNYYAGGVCRSGTTGTNQANFFSPTIIDILDYANTNKKKTFKGVSGTEYGGTYSFLLLTSGAWYSTVAINSITLVCDTGANFVANSHFALYGIKAGS